MPRTQQQIVLELRRMRKMCREADDNQLLEFRREIDKLLDERLEQKNVHPPECKCHACHEHVVKVLARRSDIASVEEFGPLG
jgi:predicted Zn-ribbon and HTH transcriptional regulator